MLPVARRLKPLFPIVRDAQQDGRRDVAKEAVDGAEAHVPNVEEEILDTPSVEYKR